MLYYCCHWGACRSTVWTWSLLSLGRVQKCSLSMEFALLSLVRVQKYSVSMEFVESFERQCGSQASVRRLRAHPSYGAFISKWSLPVYFQIRSAALTLWRSAARGLFLFSVLVLSSCSLFLFSALVLRSCSVFWWLISVTFYMVWFIWSVVVVIGHFFYAMVFFTELLRHVMKVTD